MFLKANIPLSASKFASYFGNFSIKHDTARSCFQLWPKIGEGGDKISRKKTGEALANFDAERGISNHIPLSASKFASYLEIIIQNFENFEKKIPILRIFFSKISKTTKGPH